MNIKLLFEAVQRFMDVRIDAMHIASMSTHITLVRSEIKQDDHNMLEE